MRRRLLILAIPRKITHFGVVHAYHAISTAAGHGSSRVCFSGHICGSVDLVIVDVTKRGRRRRSRSTVEEEYARSKKKKEKKKLWKEKCYTAMFWRKRYKRLKDPFERGPLFFLTFALLGISPLDGNSR